MIAIREISVKSYDISKLTIEWEYEVQPPGVDLSNTSIDIHRSESDDFSNYIVIANGLNALNTQTYTDTTLSGVITRRYNDVNYRLRFVEPDGEETISKTVWLTSKPYPPATDIIRRKNNILRLRGLSSYVLKRKTYGTPCTDCYDSILDSQIDGNCSTCYNTKFVGGYHSAIATNCFLTQTPDQNMVNIFGEFNPGQGIYSLASYPRLSVNDLVIDHLNRHWWITRINNISYRGYIVAQDALITLVDHNDVVNNIEV